MKKGRGAILILCSFLAVTLMGSWSLGSAGVLSFKDWKSRRVTEARAVAKGLELEFNHTRPGDLTRADDRRLEQARLNVRIAQDLSPNDYFLLYLRDQIRLNASAMGQAVKKMSPGEIGEILKAYDRSLERREFNGKTPGLGQKGFPLNWANAVKSARAESSERFGLN